LFALYDGSQGWIIAGLSGIGTAVVAAFVDLAVPTVSDWKTGYCSRNIILSKDFCCPTTDAMNSLTDTSKTCEDWTYWTKNYWAEYSTYVAWALLWGILSASLTLLTKRSLPAASPGQGDKGPFCKSSQVNASSEGAPDPIVSGKSMYMAAGSGIPEIKTILSGFVIPHFLDLKILVVKAVGSIFAVSTGMCLGKEGPFVHISVCVANLIGSQFPKYAQNGRKIREVYAAGCAAGLSVAFGAPIGGVLFAYEEISTYFPRKVLWRAFICSLFAAITLRQLNPTGSGKLVLFETNYGATYLPYHYPVFILLGVCGGIFGGLFCKLNFKWSRSFRKYAIIKNYPVLEVCLVVFATAILQFPNPLTREPGDIIIKNLLVDCSEKDSHDAYVCVNEQQGATSSSKYLGWLIYGTLVKLILTVVTFGIKVPSGIIIPALDAGAFTGRLIGQVPLLAASTSPGIFAMVGAGAFLAGVSRMTISLAVIMFELTGELEFIVPNMIGIMVAKWVADALEPEGVYDLAQTVLGHPFLDLDVSIKSVQRHQRLVEDLIPPSNTMNEIKVELSITGTVSRKVLEEKLYQLKRRGLMDAGLVLISKETGVLRGYLAEAELEFGLTDLSRDHSSDRDVRLLDAAQYNSRGSPTDQQDETASASSASSASPSDTSSPSDSAQPPWQKTANGRPETTDKNDEGLDLRSFVDRTPLTLASSAPIEYAVEMFGKLGLRYLIVTEEGSGRVLGVVIKKRLLDFLERLKHQ
jgi:chloride channel 3/4/5